LRKKPFGAISKLIVLHKMKKSLLGKAPADRNSK
jgi:hypothetical protein